ncbi:YdeI/OmpD-associated family protein [Herbiconiux sp. CPCC 205716]|uniref:YdeI/OmpD-associated family protein n=1 Tax=Herbiconiux gentiana TaxID=2970912 RepID=A0ABT2GB42_9MICO|nr:YdeI/OmpD-associated family protein [Herbiconiux gentiana]MCS5713422.1 YdeI/OmpD-associated family protein [Herbiconiux gentiana]
MEFTTTILASGKNNTGIPVPESVVTALDRGKRIPVVVTIGGHSYRSSIVFYTGQFLISLSAENRAAAGVAAGDTVVVDVELDEAPREVEVPDALAAALAVDADAAAAFAALSYSNKKRIALSISDAKTDATRERRVAKALEELVS